MKRMLASSLVLIVFLVAVPAVAAPSVLIEPVRAEVDRNWLRDIRESRAKAGAIREDEARSMADDMARSFRDALDQALRAQGFQVVTAPSPGAVRVSARLDDVYVSAPENTASGAKSFTRQAGRATMHVQVRDAAGATLLESQQRSDAGDMGRLQRATNVSNRFWFDALFRDWSDEVAKELKQKAR